MNIKEIIKNIIPPLAIKVIKYFKKPSPQSKRVAPFFKVNGDKTLRLDYDINENSTIFDMGGHIGDWSADIFCKYQPYIYIFEPSTSFYNKIKDRFSNNNKVKIFNFGLSKKSEILKLYMADNASSIFIKERSDYEDCRIEKFDIFLENEKIEKIDLMKINIEGGEYDLLEGIIETGFAKKINNIQVQFHDFIPNSKERMSKIQNKLKETHICTWQFEFVWENWELK